MSKDLFKELFLSDSDEDEIKENLKDKLDEIETKIILPENLPKKNKGGISAKKSLSSRANSIKAREAFMAARSPAKIERDTLKAEKSSIKKQIEADKETSAKLKLERLKHVSEYARIKKENNEKKITVIKDSDSDVSSDEEEIIVRRKVKKDKHEQTPIFGGDVKKPPIKVIESIIETPKKEPVKAEILYESKFCSFNPIKNKLEHAKNSILNL